MDRHDDAFNHLKAQKLVTKNIRPENQDRIWSIYYAAHVDYEIKQGPEVAEAMQYILDNLEPRESGFIEIGSAYGGSFACWASIISGPAISIDLPGITGEPGLDKTRIDLRNNLWFEQFPGRPLAINGDSHRVETFDALNSRMGSRRVDFLFIDGDHSYVGTKQDFEVYSQFIRPGGLVGFHDIRTTPAGDFFRELALTKWESPADSGDSGLGIVRMPE
jgi:cephalosporin hydroxylase